MNLISPRRRSFCCFAAFYRATGSARDVAENAEFEQV